MSKSHVPHNESAAAGTYDPPRRATPTPSGDALEVQLAFDVRPCGTCTFFWPPDSGRQPYGPYSAFDFDTEMPVFTQPPGSAGSFKWLKATTKPARYPDPGIMDGCRKAPIMTIGINPNLTAFLPGQLSAAWCYPSFSDEAGANGATKYAYYYRYRSVYQERFDRAFIEPFLAHDGEVVASRAGLIISATRDDDSPSYSIQVRYDGDANTTTLALPGEVGKPGYVLMFDTASPRNRFMAGDLIAARLEVLTGQTVDVFAQQVGYYQRMRPVLDRFERFLEINGSPGVKLQVGEDVGQLDMVGCASPHWGPAWLGGTSAGVQNIIHNCVSNNAWALKQLIQSKPAVLFLVGEASYNMFRLAFGSLLSIDLPLPPRFCRI